MFRVAGARVHGVHDAGGVQAIRDPAEQSGFPANRITPIGAVIAPSTADG